MTQGHHPTHAGLQKHSVGDIYPLAIVGVGDHWELHNLQDGTVLCYGERYDRGRVTTTVPSKLLTLLSKMRNGTALCKYTWRPLRQSVPQYMKATANPQVGSRANWYGEQGTDPVQTEADLPPPGLNLFVGAMLTEEESNLIRAFRSVKPYDRSLVLHFTNKLKA